jgi:hypothetical protein
MITSIFGLIFSALLGALISRHYSNRRALSYLIKERKLLDPVGGQFPADVQVSFAGVSVERLSEWNIFLWNSGNQTIALDDLIDGHLTFDFKEMKIVGQPAASAARESTKPTAHVTANQDGVAVSFSYLDSGDSIGITAYSNVSKEKASSPPSVEGNIKGIPRGPKKWWGETPSPWAAYSVIFGIIIMALLSYVPAVLMISGGSRLGYWQYPSQIYGRSLVSGSPTADLLLGGTMLLACFANTLLGIFLVWRRFKMPAFVLSNSRK